MSNSPTLSPKQVMQELNNQQGYTGVFSTTVNPIAEEIRNAQHQRRYYHTVPVIPFYEGGDVTLQLMQRMAKLSPTHGAVINSVKHYVLGGQFEVVARKVAGFARRESDLREVDDATFVAYTEWLSKWIDGGVMLNTLKLVADNFMKFGNAFIEVVLTRVAGQQKVAIYNHDVDRCLYFATLEGMDRIVLINPYWYHPQNYGTVPDAVPLYPRFVDDGAGTQRTMIHLKNEVSGRDWYGEPAWLAALYDVYGEMQRGQYKVQGYASDFTGRIFIETFEGVGAGHGNEPPPAAPLVDQYGNYLSGPQGFYRRLKQFYTHAGQEQRTILHRNAPADGQPSQVHQFKPNTNEKYHTAMAGLDETGIIKIHDWHPALLGIQTPGRLGQNQEFATAFKQKYYTKIKPQQDFYMDAMNLCLRIIADFVEDEGRELVQVNSLGLKNLYADMLKETDGKKGEKQQEGAGVDEGDALDVDDNKQTETDA